MARKNNRNDTQMREAMRQAARDGYESDLRDGRRQRAASFGSPKDYKRKGKYGYDYRED